MPRPIITNNINVNVNTNINKNTSTTLRSGVASDRDLLKKRSSKYIKLMTNLDHGTLTKNTHGFGELIDRIKEEFGDLGINEYPVGVVTKCFLGHPYEVHTLDLSSAHVSTDPNVQIEGGRTGMDISKGVVLVNIIDHYKKGERLPDHLEKARALALHNSYAMIEVYASRMILVREDGSTSKL